MNIQDWFPLGLTDLISLQYKGLLSVLSNTMTQKVQRQCFWTLPKKSIKDFYLWKYITYIQLQAK